MTNSFVRTLAWFASLALLYLALHLYWNHKNIAGVCSTSSTLSFSLLALLFIQRGCFELYRRFYRGDSASLTPLKINRFFSGRSALWIKFCLSLVLIVSIVFSVLESSVVVFSSASCAIRTMNHDEGHSSAAQQRATSTAQKSSQRGAPHHDSSEFREQLRQEDEAAKRVYNRHHSMVDADRSSFDTLARSKKNHENHINAFSPGSVPAYYHHLDDDDDDDDDDHNSTPAFSLCPLSTSLLSSVFLSWLIHSGTILFIGGFFLSSSSSSSSSGGSSSSSTPPTKRNKPQQVQQDENPKLHQGDENQVTLIWALGFDTFTELKMSTNIAVCTFLVNWASHSWDFAASTNGEELLESYHTFSTGLWILYFEFYYHCLPAMRALSLSLSDREVRIVAALQKSVANHLVLLHSRRQSVKCPTVLLRATKTELGELKLILEVKRTKTKTKTMQQNKTDNNNDNNNNTKSEVISIVTLPNDVEEEQPESEEISSAVLIEKVQEVVKMNALWERVFDVNSISVM